MKLYQVLIFLLASSLVLGQGGDKVGTGGATELLIPVFARNIALGGSNLSTVKGLDAIQTNPAGVVMSGKSEAAVSTMSYIADIDVQFFGVSIQTSESSNIAVWGKSVNLGDIQVTTLDAQDGLDEYYNPTLFHGGLTYSKRMTEAISFGVTAKYIVEEIQRTSATGVAFDFGLQYRHNSGTSVGFALKNIGGDMQFNGDNLNISVESPTNPNEQTVVTRLISQAFTLPVIFEMSVGYEHKIDEQSVANAYAKFSNNDKADNIVAGGVEYIYDNMFSARVGYEAAPENSESTVFGPAFGMGVNLDLGGSNFVLDYAYRSAEFFDGSQVFTIKLNF